MPKPMLKPPFIMNSDGESGCLPNTGALERERGRTFAHVQIGSLPFSSGNMFEAFKIKAFKLSSLVSSCSKLRSDVEPTATVPSKCGIKCKVSAKSCAEFDFVNLNNAACPFTQFPKLFPNFFDILLRSWTPVAQTTLPWFFPSKRNSQPSFFKA